MATQRTGGMTAIGVVNIVLGVIGCLFSVLVLVGGGVLAAGGGDFAARSGDESFGMMAQGAGMMVMVIGFVGLVTWLLTMISGIGVLMMRSWGRTLAMLCGAVLIVVNVLSIINGGMGVMTIATLIYGALLLGLFMKPSWKMAFCGGGEAMIESAPPATDTDDDMRAAA